MARTQLRARWWWVALVGVVLAACGEDSPTDVAASSVTGANQTPTISGTPTTSVNQNAAYSFTPSAVDADGDPLIFGVEAKPVWAMFNTATGQMSGTPTAADAGTYRGIVIWVSDGKTQALLPAFDLTVVGATPVNRAPTISGTPPASVTAGSAYTFTPSASDADGNALTFSIVNRPAWASFSAANGRLQGTPQIANVGTFANIVISVSDGQTAVALPAFSIVVTPPTTNTPPVISGAPMTSVAAGTAYAFVPTASDADGNHADVQHGGPAELGHVQHRHGPTRRNAACGRHVLRHRDLGQRRLGERFARTVLDHGDGADDESPADDQRHAVDDGDAGHGVQLPGLGGGRRRRSVDVLDRESAHLGHVQREQRRAARHAGREQRPHLQQHRDQRERRQGVGVVVRVLDHRGVLEYAADDLGHAADLGDGRHAYTFTPTASDANGGTLTFSITNKPSWATFSSSTGRLQGTPASGDVGTYANIVIGVSDGQDSAQLPAFAITVSAAPNHAPTISGTPATTATQGTAYSFQASAADADSDPLTFSITNRPTWATFNVNTGALQGTPGASNVGTFSNIVISVSDGKASASLAAFAITVAGSNTPPTISGTPPTTATVGTQYTFTPTAADANGDTLTFSITNKPSWATFTTSTGRLQGTPASGNVGAFAGIVISVSDGQASAQLPAFTITVSAPPNRAPTISGTAPTAVMQGTAYTFTPTASDPDGDTLTFSITNKPSWATFNTSTGRLQGTPTAGDVGTTTGVVIGVSDGTPERGAGGLQRYGPGRRHGLGHAVVDAAHAKYGRLAADGSRGLQGLLGHVAGQLSELRDAEQSRPDHLYGREPGPGHLFLRGLGVQHGSRELVVRRREQDHSISGSTPPRSGRRHCRRAGPLFFPAPTSNRSVRERR